MSQTGELIARALSRRRLLAGAAVVAAAGLLRPVRATEMLIDIDAMKPGEFTWHPDRQPDGPVSVVVSLDQQRVHVYRNGVRIAVSTCSTGKKGHETPTGVFVVLQKDKDHHSSTYNDAAMPNMNRLTWDGIALHAGNLPGYPASHGCVRLPMEFSSLLYGITHVGTPVIIASSHSDPYEITHPGPILNGFAEQEMAEAVANTEGKKHPSDWAETETMQFVSVVISTADGAAVVVQNDEVVDKGPVTYTGTGPVGQHVFTLQQDSGAGITWHAISHHNLSDLPPVADADLLNEVRFDQDFAHRLAKLLHPGSVMIITETPILADSRSSGDFVILSTEEA